MPRRWPVLSPLLAATSRVCGAVVPGCSDPATTGGWPVSVLVVAAPGSFPTPPPVPVDGPVTAEPPTAAVVCGLPPEEPLGPADVPVPNGGGAAPRPGPCSNGKGEAGGGLDTTPANAPR